jgi:stage II sporulation protein D
MASTKRNTKKKKKSIRGRFFVLLVLAALFLVCIIRNGEETPKKPEKTTQAPEATSEATSKPQKTKTNRDDKKIRVLLKDSNLENMFHSTVKIKGTSQLVVSNGTKSKTYSAGKKISFTPETVKKWGKKVTITCEKGKIKVISLKRTQGTPAYRGSISLTWNRKGLVMVNTLSLGEYLYSVIPSEMPTSYPMEALKAQAVCARSFAWKQMKSERYEKYGADVDDSTDFQVYNNVSEDARSRKAVKGTAGKLIFSGKHVLTTYYYSTSWGVSASLEDAWGGGEDSSCYQNSLQITEKSRKTTGYKSLDLSGESAFASFIQTTVCDTYDSDYGWYRWRYQVSAKQLGARLGIGTVKKIMILKRKKSGILWKIRVKGTKGRVTLEGQEKIRSSLMVAGVEVEQMSSDTTASFSILPSAAFFVQEAVKDGEPCFVFLGGGMGHGVGMSQNGAASMAKEGNTYRQILMHYYKKCNIR